MTMKVKEIVKFLEWAKKTFPIDSVYQFGDRGICDWKHMVNKNISLLEYLEAENKMLKGYKDCWESLLKTVKQSPYWAKEDIFTLENDMKYLGGKYLEVKDEI